MSARSKNIYAALLVLVLGVSIYAQTLAFPQSEATLFSSGPELFPRLLTAALMLLGLWLLAASLVREAENEPAKGLSAATSGLILLLLVSYALVLEWLGFLLATPVFVLVLALLLKSRLRTAALLAISFTVVSYVVFQVVLKIPLPTGPLPGGFELNGIF